MSGWAIGGQAREGGLSSFKLPIKVLKSASPDSPSIGHPLVYPGVPKQKHKCGAGQVDTGRESGGQVVSRRFLIN